MTDIIRRIIVVIEEVIADQSTVTIEDVVLQIGMRVFDTTINDSDHDFA